MQLEIPERDYAGYIFDCDGTLADTMPAHYEAWRRALKEGGAEFPEELFYQWGGRPSVDIVRTINAMQGLALDVDGTVSRKEGLYLEAVHAVEPIRPVLDFARSLRGRRPLAVASGGHRELVMATLATIGATDLFDAIICFEDYQRGKPAPDPFLTAAERLGVPAGECLVFEDSPAGIQAAEAAGMDWVLVPAANPR